VDLEAVAADLDSFFEIDTFQPDSPFSGLVPSVYGGTGIDLDVHLEGTFLKRFHGLMLRNSSAVLRIYTVVFLSNGGVLPLCLRSNRNAKGHGGALRSAIWDRV
jgi:hypothetical protein